MTTRKLGPKLHTIPFTEEGYRNVQAEYVALLEKRPEAVENLRKSREMGDLSENGYYKASRARLSEIDGRLRRLLIQIRLGRVVKNSTSGAVEIGSTVKVSDGKQERTFQIVGGYESNPLESKISHHSPIGKALLGKRKGESAIVEIPAGRITYTILDVRLGI